MTRPGSNAGTAFSKLPAARKGGGGPGNDVKLGPVRLQQDLKLVQGHGATIGGATTAFQTCHAWPLHHPDLLQDKGCHAATVELQPASRREPSYLVQAGLYACRPNDADFGAASYPTDKFLV